MTESNVLNKIRAYRERYLPDPSPLWSHHNFKMRSYAIFTAEDMEEAVWSHPFSDPDDIVFDYILKATDQYKNCGPSEVKEMFHEILIISQAIYEYIYGTEEASP